MIDLIKWELESPKEGCLTLKDPQGIIKYFEKVRELHKSGEQFPVDLDLVWMLVYEHKHKAIETLKENFIQMTESQSLTQKGERLNDNELQNGFDYKVVKERVRAGHTFSIKEKYHLSVSCMEHFIVRKVRHVFDVFKDIFYKPVDEPVPRTSIKTGLIQVFSYNNENVTMKMDNEFVYVNATEMAKTFNTKPANWLRTEQSERLIFALTVSHKCDTADLVKVVQGGNEQGTWFHEEVALIFAQWLSPEFYILCNRKIKELLTKGYAKLENISRKDLAKMLYESEVEKEEMQIEIGRRDEKIGKLAPKAECYERIQPTFGSMSIRQVAKVAGTGEKRLFKLLRDKHILTHNNEPYQRYLDAGYFEMSYNDYEDNNGREHSYFQTRVTGKGLPFVCKIVDENK